MMLLTIFLLVTNVLGFVILGLNKLRARVGALQIPDAVLLLLALLGGSIGSLLGFYLFPQKARRKLLQYGLPAILALQLLLLFLLWKSPIEIRFM